jgi:hypothetical protein
MSFRHIGRPQTAHSRSVTEKALSLSGRMVSFVVGRVLHVTDQE